MAQQTVNTTDTVEQFRGKANANFTELYNAGLPLYYADTGGDDSYVITTDLSYSALTAGMAFALKPTTGNTGACTLAVDSTGAIAIKVVDASGVRDPLTGEIPAGGLLWLQYNGTYWILLNPAILKKRYVALVSQSGTSSPTAVVLENSLGGTPAWSYTDVGHYAITLSNAFSSGKTVVWQSQSRNWFNPSESRIEHALSTTSTIEFMQFTNNDPESPTDEFDNCSVIIEVYP